MQGLLCYHKVMICKNCGGEFSDELTKCPYCGTMNRKGAYKDFRRKVSNIIDKLLGLKAEAYDSVSKMIGISLLRSLVIVVVVCALALGASMLVNVNYYNDAKYDEESYQKILWENENLSKLNEAYEGKDFKTVEKLLNERYSVSYSWEHYSAYCLEKAYLDIMDDEHFNEYVLEDLIYYCYYPGYFTYSYKLNAEEKAAYEENRAALLKYAAGKGYSESELQQIYEENRDDFGYISASDVRKYMKEGE